MFARKPKPNIAKRHQIRFKPLKASAQRVLFAWMPTGCPMTYE